jgi:hypothetical protein
MEGVSLSYKKGNQWKTIFPFGNVTEKCHEVRVTSNLGVPIGSLAGPDTKIQIIATNNGTTPGSVIPVPPPTEGEDFGAFIDLTSSDTHPLLASKPGWERNAVSLEVDGGVLSMHEPTRSRLLLKDPTGTTKRGPSHFGYSGRVDLEADNITIAVTRDNKPARPIQVTNDAIVIINNECPGNTSANPKGDLEYLYDYVIYEPGISLTRRFTVERDPRYKKPSTPIEQFTRTIGFIQWLYELLFGKPVWDVFDTNFGAYSDGLPCNKFVVTKSDGLP